MGRTLTPLKSGADMFPIGNGIMLGKIAIDGVAGLIILASVIGAGAGFAITPGAHLVELLQFGAMGLLALTLWWGAKTAQRVHEDEIKMRNELLERIEKMSERMFDTIDKNTELMGRVLARLERLEQGGNP
jgi:uncharacterized membrane protein